MIPRRLAFRRNQSVLKLDHILSGILIAYLRFEVCGDYEVVIRHLNGQWCTKDFRRSHVLGSAVRELAGLLVSERAHPPGIGEYPCRHVFREENGTADRLANMGREGKIWARSPDHAFMSVYFAAGAPALGLRLRVWFDGSFNPSGAGVGVWGEWSKAASSDWTPLMACCRPCSASDAAKTEALAAAAAVSALRAAVQGRLQTWCQAWCSDTPPVCLAY